MTNKELAYKFVSLADQYGFNISIRNTIVSITKHINGNDEFRDADMSYYSVLDYAPALKNQSSVWGTDGGSIGGLSAIKSGLFKMNKSGIKKGFLTALRKEMMKK